MTIGRCPHGEFELEKGCPECIAERRQQGIRPEQDEMEDGLNAEGLTLATPQQLVKVQYFSETTGEISPREYTYYSADQLKIGDIVIVPVRDTTGKAKISAIDVPEAEIAAFKDKIKTIPAKSVVEPPTDELEAMVDTPGGKVNKFNDTPGADYNHDAGHNLESYTPESATRADIFIEEYDKMAEESTYLNESPQAALTLIQPKLDPQVVAFYNEAVKLKEYAEARVITTIVDLKPANDDLNIIRRLKKAMEARRKEYLAPFQDHVKETNEAYKNLMEPVDIADKITTDKMLAFNREQERIRREQEEINRLREAAAQKQKELTGEIAEVEVVEVVPEAPKHVSTEMGSTGVRDNWKWEVTDFSLVPDDYKMINAGVLTPVVKASKGKVKIAGIRIYNDPILAVGR